VIDTQCRNRAYRETAPARRRRHADAAGCSTPSEIPVWFVFIAASTHHTRWRIAAPRLQGTAARQHTFEHTGQFRPRHHTAHCASIASCREQAPSRGEVCDVVNLEGTPKSQVPSPKSKVPGPKSTERSRGFRTPGRRTYRPGRVGVVRSPDDCPPSSGKVAEQLIDQSGRFGTRHVRGEADLEGGDGGH
jgi:hypothetical protein